MRSGLTGSGQELLVGGQPGDVLLHYLGLGRLPVAVWRPDAGGRWIPASRTG
ncbi:MAG TPA: hypothetical protein VKZ60_09155 [Chloroflexota bacterium]|nr:hypothetical protein [Chloroflexota bacterium]